MTETLNLNPTQAPADTRPVDTGADDYIFLDDDERRLEINTIVDAETSEQRAEALADVLSNFWMYLNKGEARLVRDEIYNLIGFTFQRSRAHRLAVEFYANRYDIKGEADLARVLQELLERKLDEPSEQADSTADDLAPQPAELPLDARANERITHLVQKYIGEFDVMVHVVRILEQRDRHGAEAFDYEMLGLSVAHLLENPHTPADVREALEQSIREAWRKGDPFDALEPDSVREFYTLALQRAESDEATADQAESITAEQANDVTETIAHLMSLPLPEKLRRFIADGLDEMASIPAADTSNNPDLLRVWLPAALRGEEQKGGQG